MRPFVALFRLTDQRAARPSTRARSAPPPRSAPSASPSPKRTPKTGGVTVSLSPPDSPPECDLPLCDVCDTSSATCTQCQQNAFLENGQCQKCSEHCVTCQGASCTKCDVGFFPREGQCVDCGNITDCVTCSQTAATCIGCKGDNIYLNNGRCVSCKLEGCETCSTDLSKCDACQADHRLDSNQQCTPCADNCRKCDDTTGVCSQCSQGFYPKGTDCEACPTGCSECESESSCSSCESGFFLQPGGVCECLSWKR